MTTMSSAPPRHMIRRRLGPLGRAGPLAALGPLGRAGALAALAALAALTR